MYIETFKPADYASPKDAGTTHIDTFFKHHREDDVPTALLIETTGNEVVAVTDVTPNDRASLTPMLALLNGSLAHVTLRFQNMSGTHETRALSGNDVSRWVSHLDVTRDANESCARFLAATHATLVYTVMDRQNGRGVLAFSKDDVNAAHHDLIERSPQPLSLADIETTVYGFSLMSGRAFDRTVPVHETTYYDI